MVVGVAALGMSFEYFFHLVRWPESTYYYIGDIVAWFLFSSFMVGEAFIGLTEVKKGEA